MVGRLWLVSFHFVDGANWQVPAVSFREVKSFPFTEKVLWLFTPLTPELVDTVEPSNRNYTPPILMACIDLRLSWYFPLLVLYLSQDDGGLLHFHPHAQHPKTNGLVLMLCVFYWCFFWLKLCFCLRNSGEKESRSANSWGLLLLFLVFLVCWCTLKTFFYSHDHRDREAPRATGGHDMPREPGVASHLPVGRPSPPHLLGRVQLPRSPGKEVQNLPFKATDTRFPWKFLGGPFGVSLHSKKSREGNTAQNCFVYDLLWGKSRFRPLLEHVALYGKYSPEIENSTEKHWISKIVERPTWKQWDVP